MCTRQHKIHLGVCVFGWMHVEDGKVPRLSILYVCVCMCRSVGKVSGSSARFSVQKRIPILSTSTS